MAASRHDNAATVAPVSAKYLQINGATRCPLVSQARNGAAWHPWTIKHLQIVRCHVAPYMWQRLRGNAATGGALLREAPVAALDAAREIVL